MQAYIEVNHKPIIRSIRFSYIKAYEKVQPRSDKVNANVINVRKKEEKRQKGYLPRNNYF